MLEFVNDPPNILNLRRQGRGFRGRKAKFDNAPNDMCYVFILEDGLIKNIENAQIGEYLFLIY